MDIKEIIKETLTNLAQSKIDADQADRRFTAVSEVLKDGRELGNQYRQTIAQSCIAILSASIAAVGLLVNAKQTRLLTHPHTTIYWLWLMWGGFGLAYALTIYNTKLNSKYVSAHGEVFRHKELGDKKKEAFNEAERQKAFSRGAFVGRASEYAAIVGVAGLVLFALSLLTNITSSNL